MKSDKITFEQYQREAVSTAAPIHEWAERIHRGMYGLVGEVGELTNVVKKYLYQGHQWDHVAVLEEIGDILWYLAVLADDLDLSLGAAATRNLDCLQERYPDGFDPERSRDR